MDASPLVVLLVAGSPDVRLALRRLLADADPAGYAVTEADWGDEAFAAAQAAPPDCVLLDQRILERDGLTILAALRARADAPIVLLTGAGGEALAVAATEHGAYDYLVADSLTPERLRLTIRRAAEADRLARERDQARAALQAGEQRLQMALEAAQLVIWDWDVATDTFTSTVPAALTGIFPPGYLPSTINDLAAAIYPPDRPAFTQAVTAALTCGGSYQVQLRMRRPSGQLRWVEAHGLVRQDAAGQPVRVVGITRDISAEKQREAAQALHVAISQALSPELDLAATLWALALLPLPELADAIVVSLCDDNGMVVTVTADEGWPAAAAAPSFLPPAAPLDKLPAHVRETLRTGEPRLLAEAPPDLAPGIGMPAPRSALLVPLGIQGRALGVLQLLRTAGDHPYVENDLALASALARRATEALTQARLRADAQEAQLAERLALARLDALVRSAPSGIAYLDRELRYVLVNPALAAINSLSPEAHLGRPLAEVLPRLDPRVEPTMRQVLATGEAASDLVLQSAPCPADPVDHYWLVSIFPVVAPAGEVAGVGVTLADITERRRADQALRETERKLGTLFELLPVGVSIFNAAGALVYVNPALERILRMDHAGLFQGVHLTRQYFRPDGTPRPLEELVRHRVFREHQPISNQVNGFITEAGELLWTNVSAVPVDFPDWRVVIITDDITQRKQAELALEARSEALSRANADLARALRLKDEFLAMMSHELRTPLNVILGLTEAVEQEFYGPLDARQRGALATVMRSGRHLLAILADILDLAHIEAGNEELRNQPIDVDHLCRGAMEFVRAAAQEKGIRLLRTMADGVEGLRADERRLTQILVNLLDNAVKFTPAGGTVGLEVSADAAQERITFTVWDTGIGIAEADYDRLFQPFTQVDGRLSREYGGIGLGLALVRRLVELHGGSIGLASAPGQGSRFTVSLPWAADDNVAPAAARGTAARAPRWAQPPRLVIADDHELTLAFYRDLLAEQGCQVTVARNGAEALAQVRATRPDIAVLDIQMPELDGLTVIRQIRADPALAGMPIIALTALAMPGDRERCLAAGASAYLAKPVSVRALLAALADALSQSR